MGEEQISLRELAAGMTRLFNGELVEYGSTGHAEDPDQTWSCVLRFGMDDERMELRVSEEDERSLAQSVLMSIAEFVQVMMRGTDMAQELRDADTGWVEATLAGVSRLYGLDGLAIEPGMLKDEPWVFVRAHDEEGGLVQGSHEDVEKAARMFVWNTVANEMDKEEDEAG